MVLLKCECVDFLSKRGIKEDKYGYTLANFSRLIHISEKIDLEIYIFLNQTDQVFYAKDRQTKP